MLAVITPRRVKAESAFAPRTATREVCVSQGRGGEAACVIQECRPTSKSSRRNRLLPRREAQQPPNAANGRPRKTRGSDYERKPESDERRRRASAQQIDEDAAASKAAQASVDALKGRTDAQRATVAMAAQQRGAARVRRSRS